MKKPKLFRLGFNSTSILVKKPKPNYFLYFLIKNLSTIEIPKLTIAPIAAKKTVLKTSSESKFGTTLKNVPPAVPINVGLLAVIRKKLRTIAIDSG